VDLLHRESIYHRDIAPDNILVEAGNRPVLLDFGAARRVIGEKSQALTAILKPAYAPIEQYGETASVKQGAWTDLYALGATMHFYLLGQAPPPSTTRAVQDEMQPLAERELPGCSKAFLKIIDWMLAPRPSDRPQSVAALVEVLEGRAEVPVRAVARAEAAASNEAQRTQLLPVRREQAAPVGVDIPLDAALPPPPPARPPTPPPMPPAPSVAPPAPAAVATGSGGRWALPAAAVGLLLAATAGWFWPRKPLPSPPPPPVAAMPAAAPAAAPRPEPAPPSKVPMVVSPSPGPAEAQIATVPTPKPKVAEAPRPPAPAASARRTKPSGPAPEPEGARPLVEAAPTPQSRPAEPTPAKAAARPSAPAPSPASAAAVVKGPRETCGRRVFVALVNCMNRECAKPENRRLAECSLYRPPN
jgi:hypothetical protein